MSPFEQQVVDMLRELHTQWAFSLTDFEFSNVLAPRVAAALNSLLDAIEGEGGGRDTYAAEALAMLRRDSARDEEAPV